MTRLTLRRSTGAGGGPAQELLEVVTARTNPAVITPTEHLCGSLALGNCIALNDGAVPVSPDIAGDQRGRRFLARASTALERRDLVGQLEAAYPHATLRSVAAEQDLALLRSDEQVQLLHLQMGPWNQGDADANFPS